MSNKYLEKIASTEDLVNAGLGAGLGYGSEILALKNPNNKFLKALTFGHKGLGAAAGAASNVIAGRVVKSLMDKKASDKEYRGPSYGAVIGGSALGTSAGLSLLGTSISANNKARMDYLRGAGMEHLYDSLDEERVIPKNIRGIGVKRSYAGLGLAGASLAAGVAAIPAIAAHRQYQDLKSGNTDSHYLRSALLGGVAGGLAPTKHLTVGRGALAGLGASAANQIYQHYKGRDQYEQ